MRVELVALEVRQDGTVATLVAHTRPPVGRFFALALALPILITRGTRAILGPRRRLEEELDLEALRTRLARGEISRAEFEQAGRALRG